MMRWMLLAAAPLVLSGCAFLGIGDSACLELEAEHERNFQAYVDLLGEPTWTCKVSEDGATIYGWDCTDGMEYFFWEDYDPEACDSYGVAEGTCGAVTLPSYLTDAIRAAGESGECAFLLEE